MSPWRTVCDESFWFMSAALRYSPSANAGTQRPKTGFCSSTSTRSAVPHVGAATTCRRTYRITILTRLLLESASPTLQSSALTLPSTCPRLPQSCMKLIKKAVVKATIKLDTVHQVPLPSLHACLHQVLPRFPHPRKHSGRASDKPDQGKASVAPRLCNHAGDLGQQGAAQRAPVVQRRPPASH